MRIGPRLVLLVAAIVVFLLVVFGVSVGDVADLRLASVGFALFAASFVP